MHEYAYVRIYVRTYVHDMVMYCMYLHLRTYICMFASTTVRTFYKRFFMSTVSPGMTF